MPSEAATDAGLVESLVAAGADCARINCAHDDAKAWVAMATHVRSAAVKLGCDCRILMDLPGPKCGVETLSPDKPKRVREADRICLAVAPREAIPGGLAVLTASFPDSSRACRSIRESGSTTARSAAGSSRWRGRRQNIGSGRGPA